MLRLLRAQGHRVMPWKNGLGSTTEIAISPRGASLDNFDWRISMAYVVEDGPFSIYDGIDRTLAVIEGEGIVLDVDGLPDARLTLDSEPLAFPADVPARSRLIGGRVRDLNIMTRRRVCSHRLRRIRTRTPVEVVPEGLTTLVISRATHLAVACQDRANNAVLGLDDAAYVEGPVTLTPDGAAEFYIVSFWPADGTV